MKMRIKPSSTRYLPRQHFLYFLPLPHGQVSFRPIFGMVLPPKTPAVDTGSIRFETKASCVSFGFVFPVGPEACPPLHFLNSVSDHAMMWIVCESRKDSTFTEGEIMLDVLHTDVPRIDEAPSVSLFD